MAGGLTPPYGLIQTINNTVTDRGEVLDSASEKLASIRREIHNAYNRLLGRLEKMLRDPKMQPRNSLERGMFKVWGRGDRFHTTGMFLLREEVKRIGEDPYER